MRDRWLALIARVSDSFHSEVAIEQFDDLVKYYTAAERHYHDLQHLQACLRLLDSVRSLAQQPDSIELAIWFHDAIYDTHKSDNEEASAQLAAAAMTDLGIPQRLAAGVINMILATRHNAPPADRDSALLIDIDLSILGQPAREFDEYEAAIRTEYTWVPEDAFRSGRSKILQSFLNRPRIYFTDCFHDAFESSARENFSRSLARLSG